MLVMGLNSCAGTGGAKRAKYPSKITPEMQASYQTADNLYARRNYSAADRAFEQFIQSYEYNEYTDWARFKRGEIRFEQGRYSEALPFYRAATAGVYNPEISPKAHLKAATALYRMKRYGETIDEVSKIRREGASADIRLRADSLGMMAARDAGWPGKLIVRFALFLLDDYIDLGTVSPSLERDNEVVAQNDVLKFVRFWVGDNAVTEGDMAALPAESYEKKPSGGYFLYKEALVKHGMGDYSGANNLLKKFTRSYPKNEYYAAAKEMLVETQSRTGTARFKVGVILPLSGRYSVYGQSVLRGIECALGIYAPCEGPKDVQIITKDSRGNPDIATKAVAELADADVQAIVGPLLSATANAAASKAQQLGIPMITLSQREGLASLGKYIFRNSVTSKSQVDTLVDYTARRKGLKRYFILYPTNKLGEEFKQLFSEAVRQAGGRVVASKGYDPRSQDLSVQIRSAKYEEDSTIDLTQTRNISYDAIFMPGAAWTAAYVAPSLQMMGMANVQLIGTMRWNDEDFIKRGGKYLDGAIFVRAFDTDGRSMPARQFLGRFKDAYGSSPSLLEGLGYDAMKLIIAASAQGAYKRETIRNVLAQIKDFQGVTGRISFNERGDALRTMQVMRINNGEANPID